MSEQVIVVGDERRAGSDGLGGDHEISARAPPAGCFEVSAEAGEVLCGGEVEGNDGEMGDRRVDFATVDLDRLDRSAP